MREETLKEWEAWAEAVATAADAMAALAQSPAWYSARVAGMAFGGAIERGVVGGEAPRNRAERRRQKHRSKALKNQGRA